MRYATLTPLLCAVILAVGVMSPSAVCQGDYRLQKLTTATFGKQLKLSLTGMPKNKLLVLMISLNGGPTPLVQLIGQDTRSLGVGIDLISEWQYLNSGSGAVQLSLPVPTLASLQGLHIHTHLPGLVIQAVVYK